MCIFGRTPKPPVVTPPAPPPPIPPAPPAPKPLAQPRKLDEEGEKTKPNVKYGRKKSTDVRARRGTDSLRIPLNTPDTGASSGGLNV